MFQWASSLNMVWRSLEAGGAFVKMAVDVDMTKFPALEAGFVIMEVVVGKGHVMVATSLPDFSVGDCSLFLFG